MYSLSCDCGYKTEGKDRYVVEATMWKHAMNEHMDQLKGYSVGQIVMWLKDKDKTLNSQKK